MVSSRKSSAQVAANSTPQPAARTRKIKAKDSDSSLAASATLPPVAQNGNGHVKATPELAKKGVAKSKAKSKSNPTKAKRPSFFTLLFRYISIISVLASALYAASVCPDDKYLEKPVCRTLSTYNRAIYEPYIQPRVNTILHHPSLAPHFATIQALSKPFIARAKIEWTRHATPQIRHLTRRASPYLAHADLEYKTHLEPTVRYAKYQFNHYYRVAEPYVHLLARIVRHYWAMAQPHLKPLWDRKDAVPGWARENVVKPLEALKAEYVDTHVEKIRHKVEEASSEHLFKRAAQKGVPMASAEPVTNDEETLAPSATPTPTPTPAPVEAAEPEVPQAPMMTPKPIVPPGPIIPDAPAPPPEPVASPTPPSADFDNDDGALDDFLRDLEDLTASATETAEPAPEETVVEPEPQAEETEEERAERVRLKDLETADKRADITARQKKWGVAVADEGEKQLGVLKAKIAKMRKEAAKGVVSPSGELRAELKKLMEERTRVAKGVEAYAKKLMTGAGKDQEKLFEGLVEKVNKRWLESVTAFGGKVQEWMAAQNAAEKAAAEESFDVTDAVSGEAQADLGMDYAWLDDVTVDDWVRYHDLQRTAEEYGRIYRSYADGSHPDSPATNPIHSAMATLQQDFEKVQASFNADIATARKNGLVLLRLADAKQGTGAKQPEVSILPVSPEEQAEAVAAEGILQRGKEEILDAAARVQGSPSPVVGDKTTESTPTAAVRDEIPIDERAAAFEKNIRAKLADTIREEEAALNAVAGATESVKSAAAAVTEGVKHAAGHVEL